MQQSNSSGSVGYGDIIDNLLKDSVISKDQLDIAIKESAKSSASANVPLEQILVDLGFISEATLGEILNHQNQTEEIDIASIVIDQKLVRKLPKDYAIKHKVIPLMINKNADLIVGTTDIFDIITMDDIGHYFPESMKVLPVYMPGSRVMHLIDQYYEYEMSFEAILKEIESGSKSKSPDTGDNYKSPTVRLVDAILSDAVHKRASDIHVEPEENFVRIRYRIDGKLVQIHSIHKDYWNSVLVVMKVRAGMNITETRKFQDGRIQTNVVGHKIDLRVASHPTVYGENIVMRILDEKEAILDLDKLGFNNTAKSIIIKATKKPEGVIIVTGPTGSGKTTTLYTLLNMINSVDKNIMTLEDPVEYKVPLLRQSNIRVEQGIDFSTGIRSLMRQDPDIILIGEVRDKETAISAINAAMTGHQVYTTLHTNDAISAIPRLVNIGVPTYLMDGTITCIIAQRLVRKLCKFCKAEYTDISDYEKKLLGGYATKVTKLYKPVGCDHCNNSGHHGRTVVAEVVFLDDNINDMIVNQATKREINAYLNKNGFISMRQDALYKVALGVCDLNEVMNSVDLTDRM